jgi:CBS domain-containing protein
MRCQDIMSRPVSCVRDTETVQAAARVMEKENVGFLPVCAEPGHVVGVLTDRDIALRVAAPNLVAATTPIGQVMTREVVSCRETDTLEEATRIMARAKKSRILVLGADGKPAGVLSLADLARVEEPFVTRAIRQVASREIHLA